MPVYDPITVTVTSDETSQCNFRYRCDVIVQHPDGVTEETVQSLRLYPEADGSGTFKVNRVLEDFVDINLPEATFNQASGVALLQPSYVTYRLVLKEEYDTSGDCTGEATVQSTLDVAGGDTLAAWAASMGQEEWVGNRALGFYDSGTGTFRMASSSGRFLADNLVNSAVVTQPRRQALPLRLNERATLCFLYEDTLPAGPISTMRVVTYDSAGAQIAQYDLALSFPTVPWGYGVFSLGVGPSNLRQWAIQGTLTPPIDSQVAFYTVRLITGINNNSETVRFDVDQSPSRHRRRQLFYLNHLGGWDCMSVDAVERVKSTPSTWDRLAGRGTAAGYVLGRSERGLTVSQVTAKRSYTLSSALISERLYEHLQDAVYPPSAYLCDPDEAHTFTFAFDFGGFQGLTLLDDIAVRLYTAGQVVHLDDRDGPLSGLHPVLSYGYASRFVALSTATEESGAYRGCLYAWETRYPTPIVVSTGDWQTPREKAIRLVLEADAAEVNVQRG